MMVAVDRDSVHPVRLAIWPELTILFDPASGAVFLFEPVRSQVHSWCQYGLLLQERTYTRGHGSHRCNLRRGSCVEGSTPGGIPAE